MLVKDLHFCRVETSLFLKQRFSYKDASHNNIGHHQEYWHALRSFALKVAVEVVCLNTVQSCCIQQYSTIASEDLCSCHQVQLDNTLPSVGPAQPPHLSIFSVATITNTELHQLQRWQPKHAKVASKYFSAQILMLRTCQVLEHLCAVCAQKAVSKCGVGPKFR